MKKILLCTVGLCLSVWALNSNASVIKLDIYKTKQFTLADIQPEIDAATPGLLAGKAAFDHQDYEKMTVPMRKFRQSLYKKIKQKGEYAFIDLATIAYPQNPNVYMTLNVVDKADAESLPKYHAKPTGHYQDPAHLIKDWNAYQEKLIPMVLSGKVSGDIKFCKEFHCLAAFSTPALKKYELEFNQEVPKHQNELVTILYKDANPDKRAAAAFLLGHTTNEAQLIQWLLPALNDSDEKVRNNAARVFLVMAAKDKTITLPIEKFIAMLHSPILTDRNKAFGVLNGLVVQPRYADVIKRECKNDLIDSLKMEQPNIHGFAYLLLEALSGQHYSERDYAAWSHWLGLT